MVRLKVMMYLFMCLSLLAGCAASMLVSEAEKLEAQGLSEEAASKYYEALKADSDNVKAKVGLKRTGQVVLDKRFQEAERLYQQKDYRGAYGRFVEAYDYRAKMTGAGVSLAVEAGCDDLFSKTKAELAGEAYDAGKNALDSSNYRQAYRSFQDALKYVPNYKDAQALSEKAAEQGKVRVAVFPFKNATGQPGVEESVYAHVISCALKYPSPFVEVIDRSHLDVILSEQGLGTSGAVEASTATRAGKIAGLNAVILGTVVEAVEKRRDPVPETRTAYLWYERKVGEETYYRTEQTTYRVCRGSLTVSYKVNYQILDTETARLLKSDVVEKSASDQVEYAEYDGDPATLHKKAAPEKKPKGFLAGALLDDSGVDRDLFKARRNFMTMSELTSPTLEAIGRQIAESICKYFDEEKQ